MIAWTIITGSLAYASVKGRTASVRHQSIMVLTGWAVASGVLLLIGGPAID